MLESSLTETWSVELQTEASIKRRLVKKKSLNLFWVLASEKTQIRHDLPPLLSRILCSSLLFVHDLFSECFQERLCISFSRCPSLDTCLFTYVLYCSLSRSSRRILTILASSLTCTIFWTRFTTFTCCFLGRSVSLYPAYFHLKPSLHELEL